MSSDVRYLDKWEVTNARLATIILLLKEMNESLKSIAKFDMYLDKLSTSLADIAEAQLNKNGR